MILRIKPDLLLLLSLLLFALQHEFLPYHAQSKNYNDNYNYNDEPPVLAPQDTQDEPMATCGQGALQVALFCQVNQPLSVRVEDLLNRLNVTEMISQLGNVAAPIPRLAMPAYTNGGEALHGVWSTCVQDMNGNRSYCPTQFASPLVLGASFHRPLWRAVGDATSTEIRALVRHGSSKGLEGPLGYTYYTPNINLIRDPRWGRIQEVPSEDPFMAGEYGAQFVQGFQYGTSRSLPTSPTQDQQTIYLKAAAVLKHWAAYSLETGRHSFNAIVNARDWTDTYMPAFTRAIAHGQPAGVMCSYNAINGEPACTNKFLLQSTLRGAMGFTGIVSTDCGALRDAHQQHKRYNTEVETVSAALRAGVDQNCGPYYVPFLPWALGNKTIDLADLRAAVRRHLTLRIQVGTFEPNDPRVPSAELQVVDSPRHRMLAKQSARLGLVLLQNRPRSMQEQDAKLSPPLLPIADPFHKIALVGPNANTTMNHLAGYHGTPPFLPISVWAALQAFWPRENIQYTVGCSVDGSKNDQNEMDSIATAVQVAREADVAIVVLGNCGNNYAGDEDTAICAAPTETEGKDRVSMELPGNQEKLLRAIVQDTDTPVILVVVTAGPVDLTWAKQNVDAILWSGYAGEFAGLAIAEALLGKVNPGGALPFSWVGPDYIEAVQLGDMAMRPNVSGGYPGRTYRFLDESMISPIWPFGHGKSYTDFTIAFVDKSNSVLRGDEAPISIFQEESTSWQIRLSNIGPVTGSVVVICYVSYEQGGLDGIPKRSLFDFARIGPVVVNCSETATFVLGPSERAIANEQGEWTHPLGLYEVECEAGGVVSTGKRRIRVVGALPA